MDVQIALCPTGLRKITIPQLQAEAAGAVPFTPASPGRIRTMARIPSTRSHRRGRDRWLLVAGRSERSGGLRSASQPAHKPAFPARLQER